MLRTSVFGCLLAVVFGGLLQSQLNGADRPNVLIIYTDDQGTLDANCYGSDDLITPNFDRLAETGVRFTQMYSPSAICSASRAGLLTGRFPARAGVPSNVSSTKGVAGMPTEEVTMAELFQQNGYRTGHVGKWHLGFTEPTMPNAQGFLSSFGHMGGCIDNYSHFFYWQGPNRHDLWRDGTEIWQDGEYFGDSMVNECQRLITDWKEEPFFIYWAINWPHYPLQGAAKWRKEYTDLPHPRREYAAFVSSLDERIGLVVDHLERLGLRDNTIIVLQSDHGHSVEERTHFGGGNPGPYRGAKGCLFEGGIRVPSIVSWPKRIPKGEVREQMAVGCDWFPTLAEYAGIDKPDHRLDGKSLVKVIADESNPTPHDSLYWQLGKGKNAQWVIRKGPWKLLGNPNDRREPKSITPADKLFLANLNEDKTESANLATKYPEVVTELVNLQQEYFAEIDD
ncbi:Arylsulfatase [Roseimaritima multifibrata]|uniref:Arylsulfatase n=1 Tax=Roseimaritima multifibrata TaxID=1930274 RepID=A0A517MGS9_9BACT|nr:sulfatase-like hydrolase/transferase [Roseimaritima multifibrata]QDS94098.1 Arylsulfatase [Roseimaritima multifibrata]